MNINHSFSLVIFFLTICYSCYSLRGLYFETLNVLMLLLTLMLFFHWINSPVSAFYLKYLYLYHNFTINWFKYDVNICVTNNLFCLWVQIKGTMFCFIFIHCFFYFNTKPIINLKPLNLFNKLFSLFLISNLLFLNCSSGLKEFNILTS